MRRNVIPIHLNSPSLGSDYIMGSSFLAVMLGACGAFCSWVLVPRLASLSQGPSNAIQEDLPWKKSCRFHGFIKDPIEGVIVGHSQSSALLEGRHHGL